MLYIFRLIITVIYSILVCVFGSIYCLFSPRNPKHVATFGHMFGRLAPLFGLKVECRKPADAESYGNAIYIANHQNNYDMVTASNIVQPPDRKCLNDGSRATGTRPADGRSGTDDVAKR